MSNYSLSNYTFHTKTNIFDQESMAEHFTYLTSFDAILKDKNPATDELKSTKKTVTFSKKAIYTSHETPQVVG